MPQFSAEIFINESSISASFQIEQKLRSLAYYPSSIMLGLETLKETINIDYKTSDVMMKTIIDLHLPTDVEIQIMKEITEFISTHAPDEVVEMWKEKMK